MYNSIRLNCLKMPAIWAAYDQTVTRVKTRDDLNKMAPPVNVGCSGKENAPHVCSDLAVLLRQGKTQSHLMCGRERSGNSKRVMRVLAR